MNLNLLQILRQKKKAGALDRIVLSQTLYGYRAEGKSSTDCQVRVSCPIDPWHLFSHRGSATSCKSPSCPIQQLHVELFAHRSRMRLDPTLLNQWRCEAPPLYGHSLVLQQGCTSRSLLCAWMATKKRRMSCCHRRCPFLLAD